VNTNKPKRRNGSAPRDKRTTDADALAERCAKLIENWKSRAEIYDSDMLGAGGATRECATELQAALDAAEKAER
jgi:hypothetical protein